MTAFHIIQMIFELVMIITIAVMIYEQDRLNNALIVLTKRLKDKGKPIMFNGRDFFEIEVEEKDG